MSRNTLPLFVLIAFLYALSGVTSLVAAERQTSWYLAPVFSGLKGDDVRPSGNDTGLGLGFGIRFNKRWASEVYASGNTFYAKDGYSHFYQRGLSLDNFIFLLSKPDFEIYGVIAIGGLRTTYLGKKNVNTMLNGGFGVQVPLADWGLALRSDVRYRYDNDRESMRNIQKGFSDWVFNIGLSVPFGGTTVLESGKRVPAADLLTQSEDSDGDGVANIIDLCKQTPQGAVVDARGCELDTDGDGVVDSRDQCANSSPQLNVNALGCEFDSDGDGLVDSKDKCPTSSPGAKVDALGCESSSPRIAKSPDRPFSIIFELDSAQLTESAKQKLINVARKLKRSEDISLSLVGHTDITGQIYHNERLSEKRALMVREFLIDQGVSEDSIDVDARGPFAPVASNRTEEGRAKNRRVELYVMDN